MSRETRNPNFDDQSDNNNAHGQELDWLAFQYVSDELSETDREQFEKRLETDLDAQTALVDVMQSAQLIYAALDQPDTVQRSDRWVNPSRMATQRPPRRPQSVLLASAAAVLLMFAGWAIFSASQTTPNTPAGIAGTTATPGPTDLAVAWADTLVHRTVGLNESDLDELNDEVELVDYVANEASNDSQDWMFIALVDMEESAEVME